MYTIARIVKYATENPIITSLLLSIKWLNGRNIPFGDLDLSGQDTKK